MLDFSLYRSLVQTLILLGTTFKGLSQNARGLLVSTSDHSVQIMSS